MVSSKRKAKPLFQVVSSVKYKKNTLKHKNIYTLTVSLFYIPLSLLLWCLFCGTCMIIAFSHVSWKHVRLLHFSCFLTQSMNFGLWQQPMQSVQIRCIFKIYFLKKIKFISLMYLLSWL